MGVSTSAVSGEAVETVPLREAGGVPVVRRTGSTGRVSQGDRAGGGWLGRMTDGDVLSDSRYERLLMVAVSDVLLCDMSVCYVGL